MRNLIVENTIELAELMLEDAAEGYDTLAVLFYDDAVKLVSDILLVGEINPIEIDISHPDLNGYSDEYYVDLKAMTDGTCDMFVAPAKSEYGTKEYLTDSVDIAYIDGDAHSSIVKKIEAEDMYEVNIIDDCDDEEECDLDCDECPFADLIDEDDVLDDEDEDSEEEDYFKSLIDFIRDVTKEIRDYFTEHELFTTEDILEFIARRFGPYDEDSEWMRSNCYYFAAILNERFPGGRIYYDVVVGHFVYEYGGVFYDYSGVIPFSEDFVAWDNFDEYDSYQKDRIIRDCIM